LGIYTQKDCFFASGKLLTVVPYVGCVFTMNIVFRVITLRPA